MRRKIKERKQKLHRKREEMAELQRRSVFKSEAAFLADRLLREVLGETVSERW